MAEDLNGEHQYWQDEPNYQWDIWVLRPDEVLEIAKGAVFADALCLIVEPCHQRAAQRHNWIGSRGLEARDQTHKICGQQENPHGHQIRQEVFVIVADDFVAEISDEIVGTLHHMLKPAGVFYRKPRADNQKQNRQHNDQQELHGYVVRNRRIRMGWMNADSLQQSSDWAS